MVWIRVLGPFAAELDGTPLALGGPLQRSVLALLVTARGRVVSVDRMIDELWRGEAPARAVASLQAYVSNLRKLLEPDRPPRTPASLLVSAPPGYALHVPAEAVDAWHFEGLVRSARGATPREAQRLLDEALALWHGPAFAEVADEPWARDEAARLEELRLAAAELRVAVSLRAGEAAAVVADAAALTREHPLREEGWRLHALALWESGRQADALATLRQAREVLVEELGLDPGPALAELEDRILHQRMDPPAPLPTAPNDLFVGRQEELAALNGLATTVRAYGSRVALVTGEAGQGKSALLTAFSARLAAEGWLVVTGRCAEAAGAPAAWPWVEALTSLADVSPPAQRADVAPLLAEATATTSGDAADGRFRLHRAVWAWLAAAARERPLAVVLDDLHWADAETLALLTGADLGAEPVLFVAAYRSDEAGPLTDALATLARRAPLRLALTGLPPDDVARLAELPADHPAVAALAERTGGNPFYVKESARLLRGEGELVALSDVPEGVRDVLRRRLARLPDATVAVLRLAAVVGRDSDVEILVQTADRPEGETLDAIEAAVIAGLLTEPAPGRVRFAHALVRDTLLADLSGVRRTRMHARVAAALEGTGDVTALAHHYARAASPKAVEYCVRAAELAERRYAHDVAAGLYRDAVANFRGGTDEHVALLGRLLRAQVRAGAITAARATRAEAIEVADREDLLVAAFTAWTEPTPWQSRPYGTRDQPIIALLTRLLDRDDLDAVTRARLLDAYADEQSGDGSPAARAAAEKAVAVAEEVGEPGLYAHTLAIMSNQLDSELEWRERERLGVAIAQLGTAHDLPMYRCFGKIVEAGSAAATGSVDRLGDLLDDAVTLARAYRLTELEIVGAGAQAMLAHVAGDFAAAERGYADVARRLAGHGSPHGAGYGQLALATIRLDQGRMADFLDTARDLHAEFGPMMVDLHAVALAAAGRVAEAREVRTQAKPLRHDFFFTTLATVRAVAVTAVGDRDAAAELYDLLLPYHGTLAGAVTLSLAMRPVAHTLGELARLLGRPAEEHFAEAVAVAQRWRAPHWVAAART